MVKSIKGGVSKDHRGQVRFVNDFDMKDVKRFYLIKNSDLDFVRGWRAHKIEQRWFYLISGRFKISFVKIDNWDNPNRELEIEDIILSADENRLIHFPGGYGTAFKALENDSEMLVFADNYLDHAKFDNYTFDVDYFVNYHKNDL